MANILVVDDEPTLRRLLRVTFGPDHRVAEAADGAEALRRLLADRPDVAIVDIAMPIMDGLAVCRAARAEPSLAGLGIIALSAYAEEDAALAAGADRYLQKPFSPLALFAMIDAVLALRQPRLSSFTVADHLLAPRSHRTRQAPATAQRPPEAADPERPPSYHVASRKTNGLSVPLTPVITTLSPVPTLAAAPPMIARPQPRSERPWAAQTNRGRTAAKLPILATDGP